MRGVLEQLSTHYIHYCIHVIVTVSITRLGSTMYILPCYYNIKEEKRLHYTLYNISPQIALYNATYSSYMHGIIMSFKPTLRQWVSVRDAECHIATYSVVMTISLTNIRPCTAQLGFVERFRSFKNHHFHPHCHNFQFAIEILGRIMTWLYIQYLSYSVLNLSSNSK